MSLSFPVLGQTSPAAAPRVAEDVQVPVGQNTQAPGATTQPGGLGGTGGGGGGGGSFLGGMGLPLMMLLIVGLFFFMTMRSQKKEKAKREALLSSLKKGDKVLTIGGVVGNVVELRDTEVVLDSAGTRLKFTRSAVQSVVTDDK